MSKRNKKKFHNKRKRGQSIAAQKRELAYMNPEFVKGISFGEPFVPIKRPRGKSMQEIILYLIINSGEIPTDLDELMNITKGTFRSYISNLYEENLARLNTKDKVHTYLLSTHAKYALKEHRPFICTSNDITSRKRHIRLARLNAFFWGLGDSVFRHQNPSAENIAYNDGAQRQFRFYNCFYIKPAVTEYTENIKRSRSFGLLTGFCKNYMVYYEPKGIDFYFEEELLRMNISKYIGTEVKEMLMVLDSYHHAALWLQFLFNHNDYFYGDMPSRFFKKVKILIMDKNAHDALLVLREEEIFEERIKHYCRLDDSYYLLLSLDVYKLYSLVWRSNENLQDTINIVTAPYLMEIVTAMTKNTGINVYTLPNEAWEKHCEIIRSCFQ